MKYSQAYYLLIAEERIVGFMSFPRVLALCEMQSASFKIWTQITGFITFDDNRYAFMHVDRWLGAEKSFLIRFVYTQKCGVQINFLNMKKSH